MVKAMLSGLLFCMLFTCAHAQGTLEAVQARGELLCGVGDLSAGNLVRIEDGGLEGFHTEFCRALAAAILGDKNAVIYLPVSTTARFTALEAGEVDILVGSVTFMSSRDERFDFAPVVFHEGKQRYAPVLREGDDDWLDLVTWTIYALIQAEEWGVTSENALQAAEELGNKGALQRFLGGEVAAQLGLGRDALRTMLAQVGNYGEIYERHLGPAASLSLERGRNNLWLNGGLMIAPPFSSR